MLFPFFYLICVVSFFLTFLHWEYLELLSFLLWWMYWLILLLHVSRLGAIALIYVKVSEWAVHWLPRIIYLLLYKKKKNHWVFIQFSERPENLYFSHLFPFWDFSVFLVKPILMDYWLLTRFFMTWIFILKPHFPLIALHL